jgi:hypothetical protein
VLFISGLDAGPVAERLAVVQRWAFLGKPFSHRELDACLAELLGEGARNDATRRE